MSEAIEVMLRNWSNSPRGKLVTFELPHDEPHPFEGRGFRTGKNGERFALAIVHIADDESRQPLD